MQRQPRKFENQTLVACRRQYFREFCMSFLVFLFSLKQGVWSWQQTISLLELTHKYSLAPKHSFSQDTIGEFPVSDPARPSKEMMSWVPPSSSIEILCFENIGSGLPGFTFLACYARTHACMHTYTHAQIRTQICTHT